MESDVPTLSIDNVWACPRCHTDLHQSPSGAGSADFPLKLASRTIHTSASLDQYEESCGVCGLPYTSAPDHRFVYPYRQLLATVSLRRFLRWSSAQNNGFISYSLMRGSSCSIEGREDVAKFAEFIRERVPIGPEVVLDLGCGPLARPAYLPSFKDAVLIGVDPFDSEWSGPFVQGVGEFLPLKDGSVDLGVAATALDHTLDTKMALGELARVIRKGGSLVVWDHTFEPRWKRPARMLLGLASPRISLRGKVAQIRSGLLPERVRIYDSGVVLWTPKGYADPFHEPRSRRPSWPRRLRKAIEASGFTQESEDRAHGFAHFVRN